MLNKTLHYLVGPFTNEGARAETALWHSERCYWQARWLQLMTMQLGVKVTDSHEGDVILPAEALVNRIQTANKANPDVFFATGYRAIVYYLEELCDHGFDPTRLTRIMELGVGLGRLIRHLSPLPAELHGCDITPEVADFSRRALSPRVRVISNQPLPPLDYPDAHFDFVYANSVFTHIPVASVADWIGELARVSQPGSPVIISVFNPNVHMSHMTGSQFDQVQTTGGRIQWGGSNVNDRNIYFDEKALRRAWEGPFEILELRQHFQEQNHLILRRTSAAPRTSMVK